MPDDTLFGYQAIGAYAGCSRDVARQKALSGAWPVWFAGRSPRVSKAALDRVLGRTQTEAPGYIARLEQAIGQLKALQRAVDGLIQEFEAMRGGA